MIVLDKHTGKLVARDQFGIGPDITHGEWSSVATGKVGRHTLGFFGAGNGYAYAFEMLDRAKLGTLDGRSAANSPRPLARKRPGVRAVSRSNNSPRPLAGEGRG